VYIGQTIAWPMRVAAHKNIDFDSCRFIQCPENRLDDIERRLIKKFKPTNNRVFLKSPIKGVSDEWVRMYMDIIGKRDVKRIACMARRDFEYSPRTTNNDIYSTVINKYNRISKPQEPQS